MRRDIKDIEDIISRLSSIEDRLSQLSYETDHYYHYRDTNDIRIDVTWLIEDLQDIKIKSNSLWISLEEKRPRAGQFVLMKNESGFIAFACRQKGTDNYYIRHGTRFLDPVAWITKDALLSLE